MIRLNSILLLSILSIILCFQSSCNDDDSEKEKTTEEIKPTPLELEQKALAEEISSSELINQYLAFKVTARSLSDDQNGVITPALKEGVRIALDYMLYEKYALTDIPVALQAYNDLQELPTKVENKNEDELPTLLKTIDEQAKTDLSQTELFNSWNNAKEHFLMAFLSKATSSPEVISLYEISKLNPLDFENNELRAAALYYQGWVYTQNEYAYLAEHSFNQALTFIDQNDFTYNTATNYSVVKGGDADPTYSKEQIKAIGLILRAYTRLGMDNDEMKAKGVQDLQEFIQIGAQDQKVTDLSLLAQGILFLHQNERENALKSFGQLNDDPDNPLSTFSRINISSALAKENASIESLQKIVMTFMVGDYLHTLVKETPWYHELLDNLVGKGLLQLPSKMGDINKLMNTVPLGS